MIENKFILKKYNTIDDIILSPYHDGDINKEDIDGLVGFDLEGNEHEFSFEEYKNYLIQQGYWGWVDNNNVIHYWVGNPDVSIEELLFFFGHEIGHRIGEPLENEVEEEKRANEYGLVAELAYKFATLEKNNIK